MKYVTIEEFKKQVWEVEGVKITVEKREGTIDHLVKSYDYERLPSDATVNDLMERINLCINEEPVSRFIVKMKI